MPAASRRQGSMSRRCLMHEMTICRSLKGAPPIPSAGVGKICHGGLMPQAARRWQELWRGSGFGPDADRFMRARCATINDSDCDLFVSRRGREPLSPPAVFGAMIALEGNHGCASVDPVAVFPGRDLCRLQGDAVRRALSNGRAALDVMARAVALRGALRAHLRVTDHLLSVSDRQKQLRRLSPSS